MRVCVRRAFIILSFSVTFNYYVTPPSALIIRKKTALRFVCLASTKQTTSKFLIDASLWNFSFQRDCHATFAMLKLSFPSWHSELKRFISFVLFFLCYKTSVLCFLKSCCPFLLALTITRLIKRLFKQTGLKLKCFVRFIAVLMSF